MGPRRTDRGRGGNRAPPVRRRCLPRRPAAPVPPPRGHASGRRGSQCPGRSSWSPHPGVAATDRATAPDLELATLDLSLGDAAAALERLGPLMAEPPLGRLLPWRRETIVALQAEALVGLGRADERGATVDAAVRRARRRGLAGVGRGAPCAGAGACRPGRSGGSDRGRGGSGPRSSLACSSRSGPRGHGSRSARSDDARGKVGVACGVRDGAGGVRGPRIDSLDRADAVGVGRVASRRPAGASLTDTERRVAELAAAGQTNREIAHTRCS